MEVVPEDDFESEEGTRNLFYLLFDTKFTEEGLIETSEEENSFFTEGCGCSRECHLKFPVRVVLESQTACMEMKYYCTLDHVNHHHVFIMGKHNILVGIRRLSYVYNKVPYKLQVHFKH